MLTSKSGLVWIAVLLFLILLGLGYRNSTAQQPIVGERVPDLTLDFYTGYEWDGQDIAQLSDLQGQIVVLNFWASWCAPCRTEAPLLEQISRDYADKGVIFVGVAWSDTDTQAHKYLEEFSVSYPNAPDLQLNAEEAYRFPRVPETFFIDREGILVHHQAGILSDSLLRTTLDGMLE